MKKGKWLKAYNKKSPYYKLQPNQSSYRMSIPMDVSGTVGDEYAIVQLYSGEIKLIPKDQFQPEEWD